MPSVPAGIPSPEAVVWRWLVSLRFRFRWKRCLMLACSKDMAREEGYFRLIFYRINILPTRCWSDTREQYLRLVSGGKCRSTRQVQKCWDGLNPNPRLGAKYVWILRPSLPSVVPLRIAGGPVIAGPTFSYAQESPF